MSRPLVILGAPSSAGAYAPGQEKAPAAVRAVGFMEDLAKRGIRVDDRGDVSGFRWQPDRTNPRAMHTETVAKVASAIAEGVAAALAKDAAVLVLGGDCTVELGTVAGALAGTENLGLIYVDLDTDLNTPDSTIDGALDWMGVAHLLGVDNAVPALVRLGPRVPMLRSDQILFFATGNSQAFERRIIADYGISEVPLGEVMADPAGAVARVVDNWAHRFERLLIHLDVDVLDYIDLPLAENTRRNIGLRFDQLMEALQPLLQAPNWRALTITEINPDHGASDGTTLRSFTVALADTLATLPQLQSV